jgi:glucosyl-dolichyl phosphate glucuronosyltransferase
MTNITVILCTLNRCQTLAKTLESIVASALPSSVKWEVLVVDNNSTDQTRDVVAGFSRRYPGLFRYILEAQPGKSFALNTGVRQAQGDLLVFTDDDVTVEPTWLQNLTASLNDGAWAGTGGRTLPDQAFSLPPWLSLDFAGAICAYFDRGDVPCDLHIAPYGANMAFRKAMFEKYGLFRTDLGPSPNREIPRPNEDTEFGRRLMSAGERLRYEPNAVVRHPVPQERLKKDYFLAWWFDFGRASMREAGKRPDPLGIPRQYFSVFKYGLVLVPRRTREWIFALNPQKRFSQKCLLWMTFGEFSEIYRRSFAPKKTKRPAAQKTNEECGG